MPSSRIFYSLLKRALDLTGSLVLFILLAPVLAILWVLVRRSLGSPALFWQERAGLHGQPFHIVKFRTMRYAQDAEGNPLPDDQRLTRVGRVLRRASLDELPQLWNVLRGEMSFVGPRPLYMEYVPRYTQKQRRRLDVKPGITGLAQINGRNTLGWEGRMRLDQEYVERASLWFDLTILARTAKKVLFSEGVPSTGVDPNKRFQGCPDAEEDAPAEPSALVSGSVQGEGVGVSGQNRISR